MKKCLLNKEVIKKIHHAHLEIHEVAPFESMVQNRTRKSNYLKWVAGDSAGHYQPEKLACPGLRTLSCFFSASHFEWCTYISWCYDFCFQITSGSLVWLWRERWRLKTPLFFCFTEYSACPQCGNVPVEYKNCPLMPWLVWLVHVPLQHAIRTLPDKCWEGLVDPTVKIR